MTFTHFKCPDTQLYHQTKELLLKGDFAWYYKPTTVVGSEGTDYNLDGWYSHELLSRPKFGTIGEHYFPTVQSQQFQNVYPMVHEIFDFNNIPVNCIYRVNANCVHPSNTPRSTPPHIDHQFPHHNLIVYLTDAGGPTIITNEEFVTQEMHQPLEDDIVIFDGWHCMKPPISKRRVVLVVTFS